LHQSEVVQASAENAASYHLRRFFSPSCNFICRAGPLPPWPQPPPSARPPHAGNACRLQTAPFRRQHSPSCQVAAHPGGLLAGFPPINSSLASCRSTCGPPKLSPYHLLGDPNLTASNNCTHHTPITRDLVGHSTFSLASYRASNRRWDR
jgi:hypothetical protein